MSCLHCSSVTVSLSVHLSDELQPLPSAEWQRLFAGHPDPPELIRLVGNAGMSGFTFRSIIVRDDSRPILVLPTFETEYPLATSIDGKARDYVLKFERWIPWLLKPRVIGVGFVEGEWGQIGVDARIDARQMSAAWSLAVRELNNLVKHRKAQAIVFWNFTPETLGQVPRPVLPGYCQVDSQPFSRFEVDYASLDDYFQSVDSDMRRYLKRVLRNGAAVKIVRTGEPGDLMQRIYQLYVDQVSRSEMAFGVQPYEYFSKVCKLVPGAEYTLYFEGECLIGFELQVAYNKTLSMKYFGMDPDRGPQYKLYFLSWLEQIRYCIDNKISHLHVGAAAEGLKEKLGARFVPSAVVFKHRNPILNLVFSKMKDALSYDSEVAVEWNTADTTRDSSAKTDAIRR
jgi:hypothetical protein